MPEPSEPPPAKPKPGSVHEVCLGRLSGLMGLPERTPWGGRAERDAILSRWRDGRLEPPPPDASRTPCPHDRHLARVAWFCAHGWGDPVVLGIGRAGRVRAIDGGHRLVAAWALRHRVISAQFKDGDEAGLIRLLGKVRRPASPFYPSPMQLGRGRVALPPGFHHPASP